jgi:hypothetical protein
MQAISLSIYMKRVELNKEMKKVLTLLSCLVTIAALAQQPQGTYKRPIPNASSAYSFKTLIADIAIGLPRYPTKLSADQVRYLGRQNDALLFADTLAGIVYWYNPHEDAVKVLGSSGSNVDLSDYYNKAESDARYLQTYIETDPNFLASAAHGITGTNITNWNTAFSWGNHAGLYKSISYVPSWSEITGKPDLSAYALITSLNNYLLISDTAGKWQPKGDYSYHLPFNGNANYYLGGDTALHALPTAGSGATPGDTATLNVHTTSYNNLLYAAINHTHSFASLTGKPTTLSGYGITDAYPLTGNPSGFLTSYTETDPVWSAVSGSYYTKTQADARYLQSYTESDPLALKISNNLSDLTNTATARTNLGLGSFATKNSLLTSDIPDISATYATQSQLTTAIAGKQATLVSGTNIKTINGTTILGSGDITISGGGSVDVIVDNTLTGDGTDASPLGVNTTRFVDKTAANTYTAGAKQTFAADATNAGVSFGGVTADPSSLSTGNFWYRTDLNKFRYYDGTTTRSLVSEQLTQTLTNKTIAAGSNTITGLSAANNTLPAQSFIANNTNASATATAQTYYDVAEQTYTGTITVTGTLTPTGTHSYQWTEVGKLVTLRMNLLFTSAGTSVTQLVMPLPTDMPAPFVPNGYSAASNILYTGAAFAQTNTTGAGAAAHRSFIRINSASNGYDVVVSMTSVGVKSCWITIQYWAQ